MSFGYGKLEMKREKKGIIPQRKRGVKKYYQTVSADLEEVKVVVAPPSNFDVNQYHLKTYYSHHTLLQPLKMLATFFFFFF